MNAVARVAGFPRRWMIAFVLAVVTISGPSVAASQSSQPTAQAPPAQPSATPTGGAPSATASRTFSAPAGLLFNTVRPDRVADFEKVIGYLQEAQQKSADPRVRAQAQGWRVFKAAEPGPGNTVLYVFVIDPALPGADYGLGRILADTYPEALLQDIWKLYTGAVTSGGTLLNLSPVKAGAAAAAPTSPGVTPAERPLPPDADPNRR